MVPKDMIISHRGISMGLEVAYKAFVGDDAGFLEPTYPFSDIDVDVADRVSNREDGVLNDQLVDNVPEMDPHVLEVGHRVIEVLVDYV